MATILYKG